MLPGGCEDLAEQTSDSNQRDGMTKVVDDAEAFGKLVNDGPLLPLAKSSALNAEFGAAEPDISDTHEVPHFPMNRQALFQADAQGLVRFAAGLKDVGDLAHRHGALAHGAQPLIDRQLLLAPDAQGLVQLAARLKDVGDLAHRHGAPTHVAESFEMAPASRSMVSARAGSPAWIRRLAPSDNSDARADRSSGGLVKPCFNSRSSNSVSPSCPAHWMPRTSRWESGEDFCFSRATSADLTRSSAPMASYRTRNR